MKNAFKFHITLIVAVWFSITACSDIKEENNGDITLSSSSTDIASSSNSSTDIASLSSSSTDYTQSIPDAMKGVIGYGYDIIGGYAKSSDIKAAVLDLNKLTKDNLVLRDVNLTSGEFNTIISEGITKYQSQISNNISTSTSGSYIIGSFSAEIKDNFGESRVSNSSYMFSTSTNRIIRDAYNIKDREDLDKYLTERFKSDLENMTYSQIIQRYGTHVMLGGVLGARLDYHYSVKKKSGTYASNLEALVSAKVEANISAFKVEGGGSLTFDKQTEFNRSFEESSESAKTLVFGGKPEYAQSVQSKKDYDSWINSIEGNEVWIDYYHNSLLPISELITDNLRKLALEAAINEHLDSNKIEITNEPPPEWPNVYETKSFSIPGELEVNGNVFNQPKVQIYFNEIDGMHTDGMAEMKRQEYKTVAFLFSLEIKEVNDGNQYIFIYNTQEKDNKLAEIELHTPNKNDWVSMSGETSDINIESFTEKSFVIRFDATSSGLLSRHTWKSRNMSVKLRFKK